MSHRRFSFLTLYLIIGIISRAGTANDFTGGGGSIYFGTGSPNSINAASNLADDLNIKDHTGNYILGVQGFFQGDRYRLGGAIQTHTWAGVNFGENNTDDDDAAGLAAFIGGLYGSYTIRYDRMLLNVGAVFGAGRCFLGYSLGDDEQNKNVSVSTFFIEPQASLGVATCRWFAVEFQLSTPIFILTEALELSEGENTYTVRSGDMMGVNFSIKLTLGKIANP